MICPFETTSDWCQWWQQQQTDTERRSALIINDSYLPVCFVRLVRRSFYGVVVQKFLIMFKWKGKNKSKNILSFRGGNKKIKFINDICCQRQIEQPERERSDFENGKFKENEPQNEVNARPENIAFDRWKIHKESIFSGCFHSVAQLRQIVMIKTNTRRNAQTNGRRWLDLLQQHRLWFVPLSAGEQIYWAKVIFVAPRLLVDHFMFQWKVVCLSFLLTWLLNQRSCRSISKLNYSINYYAKAFSYFAHFRSHFSIAFRTWHCGETKMKSVEADDECRIFVLSTISNETKIVFDFVCCVKLYAIFYAVTRRMTNISI